MISLIMIRITFTLAFYSFFLSALAQNPYCFIGKQHNALLEKLIHCNQPHDYQCFNPIIIYHFSVTTTYGDPEILDYLSKANLPTHEKQIIEEFLQLPDDLPLSVVEPLIDSLERSAIQRKFSPISLGFWSIAKHSLQFWKNYKWDNDKKPPVMAIIKADALGLIKGVVIGAFFWVVSNFVFEIPDSIGIIGGSTIAISFTALDSFRFSKKYKKRAES